MFELMEFLFLIAFILMVVTILVVFITQMARGVKEWNKNNHAPRLTVEATVAAKRTDVGIHNHASGPHTAGGRTYSMTYYVTFQVESGDRLELTMPGSEYGLLIEGDRGKLTFQGTRYLGFQRI